MLSFEARELLREEYVLIVKGLLDSPRKELGTYLNPADLAYLTTARSFPLAARQINPKVDSPSLRSPRNLVSLAASPALISPNKPSAHRIYNPSHA